MSRSGIWAATAATSILHVAVLVVPLHFEASARTSEAPVVFRLQAIPPVEPPPEPEPVVEPPPVVEEPEPPPEPPPPTRHPRPVKHTEPSEEAPEAEPVAAPVAEAAPPQAAPEVAVAAPAEEQHVAPMPESRPQPVEPTLRRGNPNYRGWAADVHAAFMRHRQYPPAALRLRLEGVAKVRVTVDRHGKLLGKPELVASSGHDVLDVEALRAAEAAAPFEALPEGTPDQKSFVIPIAFRIVD